MERVPTGHPAAIVRPNQAQRAIDVERRAPSDDLWSYVDYHWAVHWQVDDPFVQQVVPQPRLHLAAEDGRLFVHGISREPFHRTLVGRGHVLGTSFLPGGFHCLLRSSVGVLTGRVVPAAELLGLDDRPYAEHILATEDIDAMVATMERYLLDVGPEPDPVAGQVGEMVAWAERQRSLTRAEDLASHVGMSLRSLQRLFSEYVGIGPKWVIARYRILDAAAAAHSGRPVEWAELAAQLGFSDQAHLSRAFAAVVGSPPEAYRREA